MEILDSIDAARNTVRQWQHAGESVALIPTMGALHEGHLSLVRLGRQHCDRAIATIFVNPTQFGPDEDLDRYPRTLEKDFRVLRNCDTDAVFIPTPEIMYPPGFSTFVDMPAVGMPLEGKHRPNHFRGVATVVMKLFQILPADVAVFGQKDYQQLAVLRAMAADLNVGIDILAAPIFRESDGLALSSRNRYLSESQRRTARRLSRALNDAINAIRAGEDSAQRLETKLRQALTDAMDGLAPVDSIDYAVVRDAVTLEPVDRVSAQTTVALIAAKVGKTRLIDNAMLTF